MQAFQKTRVTLFFIGLFTFSWALGPSFIQTNGSWFSSKGGGFVGFYLSEWIGKSALYPIYIQACFYIVSISLILLGLNIPFIRFSKYFSKATCHVAKNVPLNFFSKLSFKLPSFSLPKISFSKNESLSSNSTEDENEVSQDEINTQNQKENKLFSFNFNKKSEQIKERIEPSFTNNEEFGITKNSYKEENDMDDEFETVSQKKSLSLFKRKEKEEKKEEVSSPNTDSEKLELPTTILLDPIK